MRARPTWREMFPIIYKSATHGWARPALELERASSPEPDPDESERSVLTRRDALEDDWAGRLDLAVSLIQNTHTHTPKNYGRADYLIKGLTLLRADGNFHKSRHLVPLKN